MVAYRRFEVVKIPFEKADAALAVTLKSNTIKLVQGLFRDGEEYVVAVSKTN